MEGNLQIVLASASPRRKELLTQMAISYRILPSSADEIIEDRKPEQVVQRLSRLKATDVSDKLQQQGENNFLVIGADTVVSYQGRIMGKPGSEKEACDMLSCLQGNTHQVYTGVTLCIKTGKNELDWHTFYEKTDVSRYPMTEKEIQDYVATGEPMDKAGAYAIQGLCAVYIQRISGDYNNVVGLPVGRLYQELKKLGFMPEAVSLAECGKEIQS